MAQTNDEIINKHPAKCKDGKWSILCVRDCMNEARLAALDDCKTLLERVLSENPFKQNEENNEYCSWYDAIDKALAELEALRKKVE